VFLAVMGIARKASPGEGWSDAHPRGRPAWQLRPGRRRPRARTRRREPDRDSRDAGRPRCPWSRAASIAGRHFQTLVPERPKQLTGPGIVLIHQSDIAIWARQRCFAPCRHRESLTSTAAYRTTWSKPSRSSGASRSPTPCTRWPVSPGSTRAQPRNRRRRVGGPVPIRPGERDLLTAARRLAPGRPPYGAAERRSGSRGVARSRRRDRGDGGVLLVLDIVVTVRERPAAVPTGLRAQRGYHPPVHGTTDRTSS
jgi:hypothetical protein